MLQCPVSRAFLFYPETDHFEIDVNGVAMPSFSGFPFLQDSVDICSNIFIVAMPSFSGFPFLQGSRLFVSRRLVCCNAQFLGLSISTQDQGMRNEWRSYVAMPSFSGFPFLRYPLKTIVKSMVPSIIFASNSQNILKFIIFFPVFGFPVFLLT